MLIFNKSRESSWRTQIDLSKAHRTCKSQVKWLSLQYQFILKLILPLLLFYRNFVDCQVRDRGSYTDRGATAAHDLTRQLRTNTLG